MTSLAQIRQEREEALLTTKLAAVQERFTTAEEIDMLDKAIDLVKEAGLTDSVEVLDVASQLVIEALEGGEEKTASDEEAETAALAGAEAAELAYAAGVTLDDFRKVASDEKSAERFGELLGLAFARLQDLDTTEK